MARSRLDNAMLIQGLVETRSKARALIMAGAVLVNGRIDSHAGSLVDQADEIELRAKPRFVSRGGDKLAHALERFGLSPAGLVCADLGASTGGFTDCLLQAGATRVYAVDVGYGQLDLRLREDPRVVNIERTNARYLESLPETVGLVVIDVSFISLSLILPVALRVLDPAAACICLIKPQFEAGRRDVGKGGVVKNPDVHRRVLTEVLSFSAAIGFTAVGVTKSPLTGPAGNIEFLALLRRDPDAAAGDDGAAMTLQAMAEE
ncbi:MAG: TlyA family RNA methyltransferase [Thermomicrobiales bacterium]